MKEFILLISLSFCLQKSFAQLHEMQSPAFKDSQYVKEFTAIKSTWNNWQNAVQHKDKSLYNKCVAPEYIHTNPGGEVTTRDKEFSDMISGVQLFSKIELIPLEYDKIRIYNGSTDIIPAQYKVSGNDHGQEFVMQTRALITMVKTNGAWQFVAWQATGVGKPFQK